MDASTSRVQGRGRILLAAALGAIACGGPQRAEDRVPFPVATAPASAGPAAAVGVAPVSSRVEPPPPPQTPAVAACDCRGPEDAGLVVDRRQAFRPDLAARQIECADVVDLAREAARRHGLEAGLLIGVMRVESGFVANSISAATAVGLMQVMPGSGRQAGCGDLFEPGANAECGARILAAFLRYYRGNLMLALSGYNAGHAMPDKARKDSRTPRNFQYVEDVLRARARYLRHGCRAF